MGNNKMKYSSYLNGLLISESDKISECIKIIIDYVPDEMNGWNNFFKNNHGHVVNNEEINVVWVSKIINNGK
jgi:hypothetical protein